MESCIIWGLYLHSAKYDPLNTFNEPLLSLLIQCATLIDNYITPAYHNGIYVPVHLVIMMSR